MYVNALKSYPELDDESMQTGLTGRGGLWTDRQTLRFLIVSRLKGVFELFTGNV